MNQLRQVAFAVVSRLSRRYSSYPGVCHVEGCIKVGSDFRSTSVHYRWRFVTAFHASFGLHDESGNTAGLHLYQGGTDGKYFMSPQAPLAFN